MAQELKQDQALKGKCVAMLMTDGVEQIEYTAPRSFLEQHGAQVVLLSPKSAGESVQGFNHMAPGDKFKVEKASARPALAITMRWSCRAAWPTPTSYA